MNWNKPEKSALVKAILAIETPNEVRRFLRDLMTETEIEEFSRRFQAAELLTQNVPYTEIEAETGLSSTTIARVAKWLRGKEGGYRLILERLRNTR